MPTATGLPRVGEVWRRRYRYQRERTDVVFRVLERSRGDYFSIRAKILYVNGEKPKPPMDRPQLFVDAAYWLSRGEMEYVGTETVERQAPSDPQIPFKVVVDNDYQDDVPAGVEGVVVKEIDRGEGINAWLIAVPALRKFVVVPSGSQEVVR